MMWRQTFLFANALAAIANVAAGEPLLLVGGERGDTAVERIDSAGECEFTVSGQPRALPLAQLVRYGHPAQPATRSEFVLVDGSRVMIAVNWSGIASVEVTAGRVQFTSPTFGTMQLPIESVRSIIFRAPSDGGQRSAIQAKQNESTDDCVLLINGDKLCGRLRELTLGDDAKLNLETNLGRLELPVADVAAILFGNRQQAKVTPMIAVGTRDGSLLLAESVAAENAELQIGTAGGLKFSGDGIEQIVFLQSLRGSVDYISDRDDLQHHHEPYFDIPWPLARDGNVLGPPLSVGGRRYLKGIGVHSASRVSLPVPAGRTHFAAELAIDDAAGAAGSVEFRVFLRTNDNWREAHTSSVIRGGDAPVPLRVALGDANEIALVVDYADRGDERDYANWLDARFE